MKFNASHQQKSPLLICNVWDVSSAKIAQDLNFKAIGTSSGAIANMLGYQDGEEMTFDELEYIVKRISQSVDTPLSVDLEAGYSRNPIEIVEHIQRLHDLGVVGINIEDSIVRNEREILKADTFSILLNHVCNLLAQKNIDLFINVRTDTFLLGLENALEETIQRSVSYVNAGAQGLFVPCIQKLEDIKHVIQAIDIPLNVMTMPDLPDFMTLEEVGVKRISMGNFVFNKSNAIQSDLLRRIQTEHSFQCLFE